MIGPCSTQQARVCQLYPNYTESELVLQFFLDMEKWDWNNQPVKLQEVASLPSCKPQFRDGIQLQSYTCPFSSVTFPMTLVIVSETFLHLSLCFEYAICARKARTLFTWHIPS